MKKFIYHIVLVTTALFATTACFDLDEEVYDKIDANLYYQNEGNVKGAVASIYSSAALSYIEYFWYLQEFPADQVTWRVWNGGLWGYDEGEKFVLTSHTWTPESVIIRSSWETAWTTIGLCNTLIEDLSAIDAESINMRQEKLDMYIAEVRTLRAWAYYNLFEIWGGVLPLNTEVSSDVPPSVSDDFDEGCRIIYDFIMDELDLAFDDLPTNEVNRMNKAVNRVIKARLLLNSEVFINEARYTECEALCREILAGNYGSYSLADDYRDIYSINNTNCPEVIMAFAFEVGQLDGGWMRNMPFLPYNIWDYFNGTYSVDAWNCCCLVPSYDNSGNVLPTGGTDDPVCFLDAPYNDKLGAVHARFDSRDIRKTNYVYDYNTGEYRGIFLEGLMTENFGSGTETLKADADRDGQNLVYVDQVGTFNNTGGKQLETVMSARWGETNSGIRLMKYPVYPESAGIDFRDIDEVEFRLAEVVYMIAECRMRAGDDQGARQMVNTVRQRYYSASDWGTVQNEPGPGYTAFDMDWMLSQWGLEFLCEGRRRRTDLRRFDKFTQGQWWFFGRASDDGREYPAQRDRKYEWYPLPASALSVNPGLKQNPNY